VERRETFHYYYPMGVHPPGDLTVTSKAISLTATSSHYKAANFQLRCMLIGK
jgi:hypothetical protein